MIKIGLLLYADDIILFAKSADELQHSLNILFEYCNRWKLTVNTRKTKVMVFKKSGRLPQNLRFIYNDQELEIVSSFKYLGVLFTSGGSFSQHDKLLAGQALKAIFKLNKYLYKFTDLLPKHILDLFDKLIMPILMFSSEVWGFYKAPQVERTYLSFCKRLLNVKASTQNDFVYGELGRQSLISYRMFSVIKYWLKICTCPESKYIRNIYLMLKRDADNNPSITNWVTDVKSLLVKLGFENVWLNQGVENRKLFLLVLKQRIQDLWLIDFNNRLENSSRALFFRTIVSFNFSKYLDVINIRKYRIA